MAFRNLIACWSCEFPRRETVQEFDSQLVPGELEWMGWEDWIALCRTETGGDDSLHEKKIDLH